MTGGGGFTCGTGLPETPWQWFVLYLREFVSWITGWLKF